MRFSKEECDKEFEERTPYMSNEKCKKCEYFYICPYMTKAMDEVFYGD